MSNVTLQPEDIKQPRSTGWKDAGLFRLHGFEILTYHRKKVVIYGYGPWINHMMDWRGMNYHHGRLPKSPIFDSVNEAIEWLTDHVERKVYFDGQVSKGHHSGEGNCKKGCSDRTVKEFGFYQLERKEGDVRAH